MKRLGYFEKLSLAARWFLPQGEAESVIDDYRDILSEAGGPEEAEERFGKPWGPVMELADRKKVRRWHMFFILMLFCAAAPVFFLFIQPATGNYFFEMERASGTFLLIALYMFGLDIILGGSNSRLLTWISIAALTAAVVTIFMLGPVDVLNAMIPYPIKERFFGGSFSRYSNTEHYMLIAGLLVFIYFRFDKRWRKPMPKPLVIALLAAALAAAGLYGFVMYCFHIDFGPILHIFRVRIVCEAAAVLFLIGAIAGIVMARMYDARWRALYIVCVMGIVLCFKMLNDICWNMNPSLWMFVKDYNSGLCPSAEWVHDITVAYTWYIGAGTALAAVGLL